jgi:hypothetical protein
MEAGHKLGNYVTVSREMMNEIISIVSLILNGGSSNNYDGWSANYLRTARAGSAFRVVPLAVLWK